MDGGNNTKTQKQETDLLEEIKAMLAREHERTRRILTRIDECMTQLEKANGFVKISF